MSTLARSAPRPIFMTALAASSTDMYDREQRSLEMASFTLWPSGDERSRMWRALIPAIFRNYTEGAHLDAVERCGWERSENPPRCAFPCEIIMYNTRMVAGGLDVTPGRQASM